jgi:hypothetical protein
MQWSGVQLRSFVTFSSLLFFRVHFLLRTSSMRALVSCRLVVGGGAAVWSTYAAAVLLS